MVLPVLLIALSLVIGVVAALGAQLRCVDAARAAARVAARGDSDSAAVSAARQVGPAGTRVRVVHSGDEVRVLVEADVRVSRWLPALHLAADAVAADENDQDGGP